MILGVDHVQTAVPSPAAAARALARKGYRRVFAGAASVPAAGAFPRFRARRKRLVYLADPSGGPSVEFIDAVGPAGPAPACAPERGSWRSLLLRAPDAAAERRFWTRGLGFVAARGGRLRRGGLLGGSLSLRLVPAVRGEGTLSPDEPGAVMTAFFTDDLAADRRRLRRFRGVRSGAPFAMTVNGRRWRACLVGSPSGALVELLQPAGRRR
jgi:hypothetical protein